MCSHCSRQERPLFGKLVQRLQDHTKPIWSNGNIWIWNTYHMVMACNCISAPYQTTYQTTYMVKYGEYLSILKDTALQLLFSHLFRNFPDLFPEMVMAPGGLGQGSSATKRGHLEHLTEHRTEHGISKFQWISWGSDQSDQSDRTNLMTYDLCGSKSASTGIAIAVPQSPKVRSRAISITP